jgi:hypothetical protein
MYDLGSDNATDAARVPARTLLAAAEGVFLWPGIPLTEKRHGFIVPLPQRWVRYWTGRLHGAQSQDAAILSALATASKHLSWGFHAAAQSALDAANLDKVSPDGAQLMRIVSARLGVVPPDMPVATHALSWGIGSPGDLALYDLFADQAFKLEKAWDESKHPRWPKSAPNSQGGRFSPKGAASPPLKAAATPGIGHNGGPPLETPPEIPPEKPPLSELRTAIIRSIAKWLITRGITYLIPGVGEALALVQAAAWLYEYLPYIQSLLSQPKTLEELQDLVSKPEKGYEIHHIAEQTSARNAGFPDSQIESADNKVRVPTLKHYEITNWYRTENPDFKGLSPREYLKDKDWTERQRVGQDALRLFGVLKP